MKRSAIIIILAFCVPAVCGAQTLFEETPQESVAPAPQVDSSLLGKSIYEALPDNVVLKQSDAVRQALNGQIINNAEKQFSGYRIRIYFNSVQSARTESNSVLNRFQTLYPGVPAFLSYSSPNFRVVVGNYRTRMDAERALELIKEDFPSATIIRDKFKYPAL